VLTRKGKFLRLKRALSKLPGIISPGELIEDLKQ
jgi:hypothetical protein